MVKIKEIPVETRVEIATKLGMGSSATDLGKEYGICRRTVYNLVKKKASYGRVSRFPMEFIEEKLHGFGNGNRMPIKQKHILDLNSEDKQEFMDSFDIILSDIDGVIWRLAEPIPNTGEAIQLLKNAGKEYKFISNNSTHSDEKYIEKFAEIGVKGVKEDDLVHPVKPISKYLNTFLPNQLCFVMASKTFTDALRKSGVRVKTIETPKDIDFENLPDLLDTSDKVAAVVYDIDSNLNYLQLCLAHQYLADKTYPTKLIVGAADKSSILKKDIRFMTSTAFIPVLAECSNVKVEGFGKPSQFLGHYIKEHFHITNPKRVLFVGDNLEMDIKFGLGLGFQTLFVLSGAHTKKEMENTALEYQPNYYADSLADFIEFLKDIK